jgi:hypothetical protein
MNLEVGWVRISAATKRDQPLKIFYSMKAACLNQLNTLIAAPHVKSVSNLPVRVFIIYIIKHETQTDTICTKM